MRPINEIQSELAYVYNNAQARIAAHKEYAEEQTKILDNYGYVKTEKDALNKAVPFINRESFNCQVWADVGRNEEYYYITDKWIVSEDLVVLSAAEYLGFAQIYDNSSLYEKLENK